MMLSLAFALTLWSSISAWSTAFVRIPYDELVLPTVPAQRGVPPVWKTPLPSTR